MFAKELMIMTFTLVVSHFGHYKLWLAENAAAVVLRFVEMQQWKFGIVKKIWQQLSWE